MTPTTAAVIAVSGAVKVRAPWVDSTSGPPARMSANEGRKVKQDTTAAAPATMAVQGASKAKIATKAAAATAHTRLFLSTREPMRCAASATMAVTAGLMPQNKPATAGTCP